MDNQPSDFLDERSRVFKDRKDRLGGQTKAGGRRRRFVPALRSGPASPCSLVVMDKWETWSSRVDQQELRPPPRPSRRSQTQQPLRPAPCRVGAGGGLLFRSPPRPSRLPLPHPQAFISPPRPKERSPGRPRVCVCAGQHPPHPPIPTPPVGLPLAWRGKSSGSAVGPPSSPDVPPSLASAGKHKEREKKGHITSSLRVKDRPPPERPPGAPLFPRRAAITPSVSSARI